MRSALSERLCTPQPGSRGRDGGRFEVCGRYLLSVEALRRWADSETDRSPQLHELRVSCWLDLTRSAARWREPAAACLAGHNYAALASYTPAVYSTPSRFIAHSRRVRERAGAVERARNQQVRVRVRAELLPKVAVTPPAAIAVVCARKSRQRQSYSSRQLLLFGSYTHRLSVS